MLRVKPKYMAKRVYDKIFPLFLQLCTCVSIKLMRSNQPQAKFRLKFGFETSFNQIFQSKIQIRIRIFATKSIEAAEK